MVDSAPTTPVKDRKPSIDMASSPGFNGFPKLLRDPKFSDLTVLVGAKSPVEFKLHRAILAERSTYFNKILNSAFLESKTNEIRLPEIKPSVFTLIVRYMYTGEYVYQSDKTNPEDLAGVYETADYLDIPDLKQAIMDIVWMKAENFAEELDVGLVVAVLEMLAKTFYDTDKLEKLVQKLLERKKLGTWMNKAKFKEMLDNYGIIGRLIIENNRFPGVTPKGWAKDVKPKLFCRACNTVKDLGSNRQPHTFGLTCGHSVVV
ncbi:hypothetical protein ABW20_dc0109052 [Dactylellina cionopaga]|nr:hypothetical protein ABW20_dc0109052 [Dactylellina cionopaga]